MPIYLIRHGQSEFNAAHTEGAPDPMIFDARLTAKGVAQARGARVRAQALGVQLVIVSPLTRALQTAQYIFGDTAPIRVMATPREKLLHSCDVGRPPQDLQVDFPEFSFADLDDTWWYQGVPNDLGYTVEPQDVFADRIRAFASLLNDISPRPIAVVGHGNAFRELIGYQMENCEICRYPQ